MTQPAKTGINGFGRIGRLVTRVAFNNSLHQPPPALLRLSEKSFLNWEILSK